MLTKRRSLARRLMAAWLAAAVSVGVSVAAPAPARADVLDDLLNEAAGFAPFFGYLKRGLDFYDNHLAGRPAVVSLQAEIRKARGEILAEIGDIAAADVSACASNTVHTFENLHLLSPDNKQAFADSSAECLFRARELIAALGPDSKAAVDELGFALNAVGPLTLVANLEAGFTTETLRQTLISGNAELLVKLRPTCAVRSLSFTPGSPEVDGKVIMQGPWKCVPYHATLADPGGTLPFPVYAATHAGLFSILDPDRWPAAQDLSIAANQAMATTSYMLAKAALDKLRPATTGRLGSPIAAATSTSATGPVKLFQARADGATQHTRRSSPTQFIGFRTFEDLPVRHDQGGRFGQSPGRPGGTVRDRSVGRHPPPLARPAERRRELVGPRPDGRKPEHHRHGPQPRRRDADLRHQPDWAGLDPLADKGYRADADGTQPRRRTRHRQQAGAGGRADDQQLVAMATDPRRHHDERRGRDHPGRTDRALRGRHRRRPAPHTTDGA
ncbi:hypothetical protein ACFQ1L_33440 [Phytohabitans flavus]|uniref:hypothetical protein n=1 Tax=Phytohabitans flavus TaxID=1076124 RepID=UPI0036448ABF